MKKFMFSAIAMIAFVGSSMASDIAADEVEVIENGELECMDKATNHMNQVDPGFRYDTTLRWEIYYAYYTACMECPTNAITSID
jgi:hypothetical protein